jgi:leukotriene-A4 hydrolase
MPFDLTLANASIALAKQIGLSSADMGAIKTAFEQFSTGQKMVFLDTLLSSDPIPHEKLAAIDKLFALSASANTEIRFRWYQLCLRAKYEQVFDGAVALLTEQGRMKFTRPLYRSLNGCSEAGMRLARETFQRHQRFYHPICAQLVAKDLGLAKK